MKDIAIIGAGGLAQETAWLIRRINDTKKLYNIIGFYDDSVSDKKIELMNLPYLGSIEKLVEFEEVVNIVIAVGKPSVKKMIYDRLYKNDKISFPNIIASDVIIEETSKIGKGNIIFSGSKITVGIHLGHFNLIGFNSALGHGTRIGSFNSIYPGVTISGDCIIGDGNEFGTGSNLIQQISIENDNVLGAGSVVIRDIASNELHVGVPTRSIL